VLGNGLLDQLSPQRVGAGHEGQEVEVRIEHVANAVRVE